MGFELLALACDVLLVVGRTCFVIPIAKSEVAMNTRMMMLGGVAMLSVLASACMTADDPPSEGIVQQSVVSECGGFPRTLETTERVDYCAAEVLVWSYEASAQKLTINDNRIELNCCGIHSSTIDKQGDTYVVSQLDAPEEHGARCSCMCVFDYTLSAEGIAAGVIKLKIVRDITDDEQGAQTIFDGTLDLDAGSGQVVLDDQPSNWCEHAAAG